MPTYTFKDKNTEENWEEFMSISEMESFLKKNKNVELVVSAPSVISGRPLKPCDGFKDVLKKIKGSHYKSNINTF